VVKKVLVSVGILSALAIACNPLMGWEDPYQLASEVNGEDGGPINNENPDGGGPNADGGTETSDAGTATCLVDNDCAVWFANVKPNPEKCAEAFCEGGACKARPVDADGDGHRVAKCEVKGIPFTKGDDCDDDNKDFYPDKTRECSENPDGSPITFPVNPPTGSCKKGTQACKPDGTVGACTGAVAPKAKDTCVAKNDDTCDGAENVGCTCTLGQTRTCGACNTGTQTCSDPGTGPTWGACQNGQPAAYGQACGSCGGTIKCDGTCSVPTPANYNANCGSCGGKIKCDSTCSVATPGNFGSSCGSCGGSITCNGSCSVGTPANYNATCGSCGGRVQCNGQCSIATPGNLGQACNNNCGSIQCNGACSNQTANPGGSCNFGCGTTTCTGSCTNNTSNVGQLCGSGTGCGTKMCNGQCSGGGTTVTKYTENSSFACCFINQTKTFGGACTPGWVYNGCSVTKTSSGGSVTIEGTGSGGSCTCTIREQNIGTEGATYTVRINERAVCSNFIP